MTLKKIINQLHLWLGLISGLVVIIVGLTGAIYTFVDELRPVFYHKHLYVEPSPEGVLPLSKLLATAEKALDGKPVARAEIFRQPDRSYMFRAMKLNPEGLTYWDYYKYYYRVYLNPYTGQVIKVENTKNEFFQLVLGLHMRLLFGEEIGHYVVGGSVLMFVFLLISGLVLWWPARWNKAGRNKSFRVKWTAGTKRLNYDLHNILGFYTMIILLVAALTGLVWVYSWMENSARFVANGGKHIEKLKPLLSDTTQTAHETALDMAFSTARERNPGAPLFLVNFPPKSNGTVNISSYLTDWNKYNRTQESYDRFSGKLLRSVPFGKLNGGDQIYQLNFDLHTGSILGLPGKILAFIACLICASLPVTGFVIWWGKKRKVSRKATRKPLAV